MPARWKVVLTLIFLASLTGPLYAQEPARIFFLHSYDSEDICGKPQYEGVLHQLLNSGYIEGRHFRMHNFYMDTKRTNNSAEKIAQACRQAVSRIDAFKPDILVSFDDNAFMCVLEQYAGTKIDIVFSGLNGQPEDYHARRPFMLDRRRPGKNITGVYEKLHVATALKVHSRLVPETKKVAFLIDFSPTGCAIARQVALELEKEPAPALAWEIVRVKSWEDYQQRIAWCNQEKEIGAIYPAALILTDQGGSTHTAPDIFRWTIRASKLPEIALNFEFTRLGLFGGAAVDFYAMGKQAGEKVASILGGSSAGEIGISEASRYALGFNLKRAQMLGIDIPNEVIIAADEVVK